MRRMRRGLAVLALAALPLGLGLARPLPLWYAGFDNAACVGPCCLIVAGFVEVSCGEYPRP